MGVLGIDPDSDPRIMDFASLLRRAKSGPYGSRRSQLWEQTARPAISALHQFLPLQGELLKAARGYAVFQ